MSQFPTLSHDGRLIHITHYTWDDVPPNTLVILTATHTDTELVDWPLFHELINPQTTLHKKAKLAVQQWEKSQNTVPSKGKPQSGS